MRLSRPFFVTLVSMRIPAHAHVVCWLLERRAVMRLRVYSGRFVIFSIIIIIINPRRACAARVTVVGLCVCLFVCLSVCLFVCRRLFSHYRLRGGL